MMFAKHIVRGLALGALGLGLTTGVSAQNGTNWHVLSNGLDVLYGGVGAGGTQVPGVDGIGTWIDGNDLKGNNVTQLGEFGYRQVTFFTSECVLGAPPAVSLNFPAILFIEFDGRNQNAQDVFTRPACTAGLPNGTTTGGFLPYGLSPGASANFFLSALPSGAGLPSSTTILLPNNGLVPSANGGTATLIAAASADLPIGSTGFCWGVEFTWTPTALLSLDRVDGWWHWQTNSANGNQYWAMSNDELNTYSSNTVALDGGATALIGFFASTEYEWHMTSKDPVSNVTLAPVGANGAGVYYAPAGATPAINPNGGWDIGRHGGVSISGTGGTLNPVTGLGTQDPAGSPTPGLIPTFGYQTWDGNGMPPRTRTIWHQVDWGGVLGVNPDAVAPTQDVVVLAGTRLPVSNSVVYNPGPGWPQAVSLGQFNLMLHTPVSQGADADPFGFAAGAFGVPFQWAATNQLPIGGLSPVCAIGLPVVIEGGSVPLNATNTDFEFDQAQSTMGTGGSVTVID